MDDYMVDFLDDVNVDGKIVAKTVKVTDAPKEPDDLITKEYSDGITGELRADVTEIREALATINNDLVSAVNWKGTVNTVADLPATAQIGDMYHVKDWSAEYIYNGTEWEEVGSILDMSGYYTKTESDSRFVNVAGDTMTGELTMKKRIQLNYDSPSIFNVDTGGDTTTDADRTYFTEYYRDKNNRTVGLRHVKKQSDVNVVSLTAIDYKSNDTQLWSSMGVASDGATGETWAFAPSYGIIKGVFDPKETDNDKILTVSMATAMSSLMHTFGAETVAGQKTFTSNPIVHKDANAGISTKAPNFDINATFTAWNRPVQYISYDKNNNLIMLLQAYAEANNRRGLDLHLYGANNASTCLQLKIDGAVKYATAPTRMKWVDKIGTDGQPEVDAETGEVKKELVIDTDSSDGTIATTEWTKATHVKKTGDTMTGTLKVENTVPVFRLSNTKYAIEDALESNWTMGDISFFDKSGKEHSIVRSRWITNGRHNFQIQTTGQNGTAHSIQLAVASDGTGWVEVPTPSSLSDNSTKVATTAWVNSTDCVVHTSGAEKIQGVKTFGSTVRLVNALPLYVVNSNIPENGYPSETSQRFINFTDKGDVPKSAVFGGCRPTDIHVGFRVFKPSGGFSSLELVYTPDSDSYKAYAPTTPDGADSNQIVTADWARNMFILKNDLENNTGEVHLFNYLRINGSGSLSAVSPTTLALGGVEVRDATDAKNRVGAFEVRDDEGERRTYLTTCLGDKTARMWVGVRTNGDVYAAAPETPNNSDGTIANANEIVTAGWANKQFVNVTGDTMTDSLLIQKTSSGYPLKLEYITYDSGLLIKRTSLPIDSEITGSTNGAKIYFQDAGDVSYAGVITQKEVGHNYISLVNYYEGVSSKHLSLYTYSDGTAYVQHPSWSVGTNDNSNKSLTIAMANSLPSLVHTSDDETIQGIKTFTSGIYHKGSNPVIHQNSTSLKKGTKPSTSHISGIRYGDADGNILGGFRYLIRPNGNGEVYSEIVNFDGSVTATLGAIATADGKTYATAPSVKKYVQDAETGEWKWVLNLNDNSNKIATTEWSTAKFVVKTGDEMTGNLYIKGVCPTLLMRSGDEDVVLSNGFGAYKNISEYKVNDYNDTNIVNIRTDVDETYTRYFIALKNYVNGVATDRRFDFYNYSDGTSALMLPQSPSSNENSRKVATTEWVNGASFVVHTVGSEYVSGFKSFHNSIWGCAGLGYKDPRYGRVLKGDPTDVPLFDSTYKWLCQIPLLDKDNNILTNDIILTNSDNSIERHFRMFDSSNTDRLVSVMHLDATSGNVKMTLRTDPPSDAKAQEVVTANWCNGKFVQKSGDEMTNSLTIKRAGSNLILKNDNHTVGKIPSDTAVVGIDYISSEGSYVAYQQCGIVGGTGEGIYTFVSRNYDKSSVATLSLYSSPSGSYATCPTPSSKTDDSNKIATTAWVNQSNFLVHSYGNEDISGLKRFKDNIILQHATTRSITFRDSSNTDIGYLSMNSSNNIYLKTNSGTITLESGAGYVNSTGNLTVAKSVPIIACRDMDVDLDTRLTSPRDIGSYTIQSKSNVYMGGFINRWYADGSHRSNIEAVSEGGALAQLNLYANADGTMYATAPSWGIKEGVFDPKETDNDKILTVSMATAMSSLMHTFGAETVAGVKMFTTAPILYCAEIFGEAPYIDFHVNNTTQDYTARMINGKEGEFSISTRNIDKSNTFSLKLGGNEQCATLSAPTPSDATENQIATANWVNDKFSALPKVYRPCGSVATFDQLPTNASVGDVYNVESDNQNYAWVEIDGVQKWDSLGATIDLTQYYTKTDVDSKVSEVRTIADGKVSKSGDTMTGLLDLDSLQFTSSYGSWRFRPSGTGFPVLSIYANNDASKPFIEMSLSSNELRLGGDNNRVISNYPIVKNDNSKTVATTGWVNTADIVCRTVGAQTIDGQKTFTTPIIDSQNMMGFIQTPNSNASNTPYYCVATCPLSSIGNYDRINFVFDAITMRDSTTTSNATIQVNMQSAGSSSFSNAHIYMTAKTPSNKHASNPENWFLMYNIEKGQIQVWIKIVDGQYGVRTRSRLNGTRYYNYTQWSFTNLPTGQVSLPSEADGWVTVACEDITRYLAEPTDSDATGNQIATANWVNNKLAGKITISTADPSGGSNGDIWFKYE